MESAIRVAVKIRPFLLTDAVQDPCITALTGEKTSVIPTIVQVDASKSKNVSQQQAMSNSTKGSNSANNIEKFFANSFSWLKSQQSVDLRQFNYDAVFGPSADHEQIYGNLVRPMVQSWLEGINCTVLAYGQTGSGKSHTMGTTGAVKEGYHGVIPKALDEIFAAISTRQNAELKCSFIELYNEELRDLLADKSQSSLYLREDPRSGVFVSGCRDETLSTLGEAIHLLNHGIARRETAQTGLNMSSSRSHAIFTLTLTQVLDEESSVILISKLHFVDLAGSERLQRTQAEGDRRKEGISINQGLLVLGKVVNALANKSDAEGQSEFLPPYRESKLTRILQDSLGGNSQTVMICCVSPCATDFAETLNALKYAQRARSIKNVYDVNIIKKAMFPGEQELRERIRVLESEVEHWRQKATTTKQTGNIQIASSDKAPNRYNDDDVYSDISLDSMPDYKSVLSRDFVSQEIFTDAKTDGTQGQIDFFKHSLLKLYQLTRPMRPVNANIRGQALSILSEIHTKTVFAIEPSLLDSTDSEPCIDLIVQSEQLKERLELIHALTAAILEVPDKEVDAESLHEEEIMNNDNTQELTKTKFMDQIMQTEVVETPVEKACISVGTDCTFDDRAIQTEQIEETHDKSLTEHQEEIRRLQQELASTRSQAVPKHQYRKLLSVLNQFAKQERESIDDLALFAKVCELQARTA